MINETELNYIKEKQSSLFDELERLQTIESLVIKLESFITGSETLQILSATNPEFNNILDELEKHIDFDVKESANDNEIIRCPECYEIHNIITAIVHNILICLECRECGYTNSKGTLVNTI